MACAASPVSIRSQYQSVFHRISMSPISIRLVLVSVLQYQYVFQHRLCTNDFFSFSVGGFFFFFMFQHRVCACACPLDEHQCQFILFELYKHQYQSISISDGACAEPPIRIRLSDSIPIDIRRALVKKLISQTTPHSSQF